MWILRLGGEMCVLVVIKGGVLGSGFFIIFCRSCLCMEWILNILVN